QCSPSPPVFLFCLNPPATTEIYTLSLHDALPIWKRRQRASSIASACGRSDGASSRPTPKYSSLRTHPEACAALRASPCRRAPAADRKSTRLNSSHVKISYAVFCLKKKKEHNTHTA